MGQIRRAPQARACWKSTIIQHPSSNPSSLPSTIIQHPSVFPSPARNPAQTPLIESSNHRIIQPFRIEHLCPATPQEVSLEAPSPQDLSSLIYREIQSAATGCHRPPQAATGYQNDCPQEPLGAATGRHRPPQVIKMIAPRSPTETDRRHPSRQDRAFRPSITSGNHPGASNALGSDFESSKHRLIQLPGFNNPCLAASQEVSQEARVSRSTHPIIESSNQRSSAEGRQPLN